MMTKRVLTDTDLSTQGWLILPTQKIENIEKNLGFTLPRNGAQVEILDNDKSYWVNLNKNKAGYYIGEGWKKFRDERDLKTGDVIQLYWKDTKFIFSMWCVFFCLNFFFAFQNIISHWLYIFLVDIYIYIYIYIYTEQF